MATQRILALNDPNIIRTNIDTNTIKAIDRALMNRSNSFIEGSARTQLVRPHPIQTFHSPGPAPYVSSAHKLEGSLHSYYSTDNLSQSNFSNLRSPGLGQRSSNKELLAKASMILAKSPTKINTWTSHRSPGPIETVPASDRIIYHPFKTIHETPMNHLPLETFKSPVRGPYIGPHTVMTETIRPNGSLEFMSPPPRPVHHIIREETHPRSEIYRSPPMITREIVRKENMIPGPQRANYITVHSSNDHVPSYDRRKLDHILRHMTSPPKEIEHVRYISPENKVVRVINSPPTGYLQGHSKPPRPDEFVQIERDFNQLRMDRMKNRNNTEGQTATPFREEYPQHGHRDQNVYRPNPDNYESSRSSAYSRGSPREERQPWFVPEISPSRRIESDDDSIELELDSKISKGSDYRRTPGIERYEGDNAGIKRMEPSYRGKNNSREYISHKENYQSRRRESGNNLIQWNEGKKKKDEEREANRYNKQHTEQFQGGSGPAKRRYQRKESENIGMILREKQREMEKETSNRRENERENSSGIQSRRGSSVTRSQRMTPRTEKYDKEIEVPREQEIRKKSPLKELKNTRKTEFLGQGGNGGSGGSGPYNRERGNKMTHKTERFLG